MQIGSSGTSELENILLNAPPNAVNNTINTGPHSVTSRSTYTVPAGKRALIVSVNAQAYRTSTPTTPGEWGFTGSIKPSGGATAIYFRSLSSSNVAYTSIAHVDVLNIFLNAGDVIDIQTNDGSIGGTIRYNTGILYKEFDL